MQQTPAIVLNDMEIEPCLQEANQYDLQERDEKQDKSWSDVRTNGFSHEYQNSYLDIKVLNIQAKSHQNYSVVKERDITQEEEDKAYTQRI